MSRFPVRTEAQVEAQRLLWLAEWKVHRQEKASHAEAECQRMEAAALKEIAEAAELQVREAMELQRVLALR